MFCNVFILLQQKNISVRQRHKNETSENSNQLTLEQLRKLEYKSLFTNGALIVHVAVQLRIYPLALLLNKPFTHCKAKKLHHFIFAITSSNLFILK